MEAVPETRFNLSWIWLPQNFSQVFYLLVLLGLLCVILKAIQLYWTKKTMVKVLRCFPGPPSHWLYGHVQMLKPEEEFLNLAAWTEKYPHCHQLWYGGFLGCLSINHPEYAKTVFSRGDTKPLLIYKFLIPWIGKGLLILNGPKWQRHRKLLTPGFHYAILKPYLALMAESVSVMLTISGEGSVFCLQQWHSKWRQVGSPPWMPGWMPAKCECTRALASIAGAQTHSQLQVEEEDKWEKLIPKGTTSSLELYEHVSLMTLDSIMKCAFSYHSNCQTDRDNYYINTVLDLTFKFYQRLKTPLYHSDPVYWCSSPGRQFRKGCRLAHNHTDKVIKERKESLKNEQELEKILKKRRLDFLDILLCAKDEHGNPLSDEDLRAEVDTFMFEGHDTTASGVSWLLYCMAQNPEHQQRCREEIQELLEGKETMEWDDLGKMTYCTMCIKESLRLYPPVPQVAREVTVPVTFADGRSLPKGFIVSLNIYGLHRNPEIWDNPEVFNPLRFSSENSTFRHPYAFLPFVAGPRNCIGQQFAMNEMKVALALTLLRFELFLDPSKPPIPSPQVVIRSMNGIHLNLKALP